MNLSIIHVCVKLKTGSSLTDRIFFDAAFLLVQSDSLINKIMVIEADQFAKVRHSLNELLRSFINKREILSGTLS
jgi:hypothetical protein